MPARRTTAGACPRFAEVSEAGDADPDVAGYLDTPVAQVLEAVAGDLEDQDGAESLPEAAAEELEAAAEHFAEAY
eukprot:4662019-Alexandrium_andersonii.AAC.1